MIRTTCKGVLTLTREQENKMERPFRGEYVYKSTVSSRKTVVGPSGVRAAGHRADVQNPLALYESDYSSSLLNLVRDSTGAEELDLLVGSLRNPDHMLREASVKRLTALADSGAIPEPAQAWFPTKYPEPLVLRRQCIYIAYFFMWSTSSSSHCARGNLQRGTSTH